MREIKFRAWNTLAKKMAVVDALDWMLDSYRAHVGKSSGSGHLADIILMQYTGLKDKHGKEIYEGDIVLRYGKHAFAVKWNDDFCGYQPFCEYRNDYGRPDAAESSALTEVIGNIYENPGLLQQAQK